ncbi:hypothetical protein ACFL2D_01605 [Patescibacteria group bacterium]
MKTVKTNINTNREIYTSLSTFLVGLSFFLCDLRKNILSTKRAKEINTTVKQTQYAIRRFKSVWLIFCAESTAAPSIEKSSANALGAVRAIATEATKAEIFVVMVFLLLFITL